SHPQSSVRGRLRIFRLTLTFYIPPYRHDGIPDKFIEGTAVLKNDVGHRAQVLIEMPDQFFRIRLLAQSSEAYDIGEQNRRRHARTFQRIEVAAGIFKNLFDQILGNVTFESASGTQLFHAFDDVINPESTAAAKQ